MKYTEKLKEKRFEFKFRKKCEDGVSALYCILHVLFIFNFNKPTLD